MSALLAYIEEVRAGRVKRLDRGVVLSLAAERPQPSFGEWCKAVLAAEGLTDWSIVPGEAYCWLKDRRLTFDFARYDGDYALWLHEIAHALVPEAEGVQENHYHGSNWAATFGRLVNKYLMPNSRHPFPRRGGNP